VKLTALRSRAGRGSCKRAPAEPASRSQSSLPRRALATLGLREVAARLMTASSSWPAIGPSPSAPAFRERRVVRAPRHGGDQHGAERPHRRSSRGDQGVPGEARADIHRSV